MIQPKKAGLLARFTFALVDSIKKAGGVVTDILGIHRKAKKHPGIQREIAEAAKEINTAQWKRACISAYRAKITKVKAGIGRNTLSGIPQWFLKQEGLA